MKFTDIYSEYFKFVYSIAFHMVGKQEDALDISQEVFFRFYIALPRVKDSGTIKPFLGKITINESLRWLKKHKTYSFTDLGMEGKDFEDTLITPDPSPLDVYISEEIKEKITQILQEIPPVYRAIVIMYYQEGLKLSEIAELLEKPEGTIKAYLHRAKNLLRIALKDWNDSNY